VGFRVLHNLEIRRTGVVDGAVASLVPVRGVSQVPSSKGRTGVRRPVTVAIVMLLVTGAHPTLAQTPLDTSNPRSPSYQAPPEPTPTPPIGWAAPPDAVVRYELPGSGVVVRRFEPPASLFGAGHRGIDLRMAPGGEVTSAADGTIHHAGAVAGIVWVSVLHADGILTSYGPLAEVTVRRGQAVRRGQQLGSLAAGGHGHAGGDAGLHLGARRGVVYLDPLSLLDPGIPRPSLVGAGSWRGDAHVVTPYEPWEGDRFHGWGTTPSPVADRPGFAVPPSPNHLVMLNGLASSSRQQPIDPQHLGYDPGSVTLLSYAGRTDDIGDATDIRRDQLPYGPEHTWEGIEAGAERLEAQLRAQAVREPGRAVDLIGHSMGGVIILHYLTHRHDPYDRGLPPIGRVVTIASPHRGSDMAAGVRYLREHLIVAPAVDLIRDAVSYPDGSTARDHLPLDAPAIDQLRSDAAFIREHGRAWIDAVDQDTAGPLAMGTEVLAIGGSRDLVVAPGNARPPTTPRQDHPTLEHPRPDPDAAPVARHTVLPGGHGSVRQTEAVREATWRFLAGDDPVAADGGMTAIWANEFGPAFHFGSAMAYLYGGFVSGLRRLVASPMRGPIEPAAPLEDLGGSARPWNAAPLEVELGPSDETEPPGRGPRWSRAVPSVGQVDG